MIIKHPEQEDIPALTALWMQAFGDTREFIAKFFRTGFGQERCLLAKEQGQLLAALYWFDCLWEGKKIAYLYAIATDENHRGKGVCRALMEHTHRHLADAGYAGTILVPANDGLVRMYAKMGYHPCCSMVKSADVPAGAVEISPEEYMALRPAYLPEGAVQHTKAAYSYLETFAKFYRYPSGIFCGELSEGAAQVQEILPVKDVQSPTIAMYCNFKEDTAHPAYFALDMG